MSCCNDAPFPPSRERRMASIIHTVTTGAVTPLALDRLPAVLLHFPHHARAANRTACLVTAILHAELEIVLEEESVELLGADGSHRHQLIALRIIVKQYGGQGLWRRTAPHPGTLRRI